MLRFAYPFMTRLLAAIVVVPASIGAASAQTGYDPYAADYSEPQGASGQSGSYQPFFAPVPVKSAKWIITVSANADFTPSFRGADRYVFIPYPLVGIRRGGQARRPDIPGDGFSFDLLNSDFVSFGPTARYRTGRYLADDRKLFGLRKQQWTVEGGAFLELWPTKNLRARIEAVHGFRDDDGWVVNLAADFVQPFGDFTFTLGPRASWASGKSMRSSYGVSLYEASLNNLVFPHHQLYEFTPESGFQSAGVAASLSYQISDEWRATAKASYNRLTGEASKSPIVRRLGDRNQFGLGLTAAYSFGIQ